MGRSTKSEQNRITRFLKCVFPNARSFQVAQLKGDASTRQYFRCVIPGVDVAILTLYPEPFIPKTLTYLQVYDLLSKIGLPVPQVRAVDGNLGMVLQEDLGDFTLERFLHECSSGEKKKLLGTAVEHLITLQTQATRMADPSYAVVRFAFDVEKLMEELEFFKRNYLEGYCSLQVRVDKLESEFLSLSHELAKAPRFVCHRDYQVRNLMVKKGRLYLIDFQDARLGPQSYDLVSLLMDSIHLDPGEVQAFMDFYLEGGAPPVGRANFERQFHVMCIQRLLKALGTYGYQLQVLGRESYADYIPGTLVRVASSLKTIPQFPYIQTIVEEQLSAVGQNS